MRRFFDSVRGAGLGATFALGFFGGGSSALATGPLINDVGNGAFVWGSSGERTTYIGPYNSFKAPKIGKLEEGNPNEADPTRGGAVSKTDLWKYANEVGTVIGTDGKLYRYHYERGLEPRRIVERRLVDGKWENVPRVVWETVLIRVLEPADSDPKSARSAKTSASAANPRPCEPAKPIATPERSDGASTGNNNADPNSQPTLDDAPANLVRDPTVADRGAGTAVNPNAPAENDAQNQTETPARPYLASVTVTTRDPGAPSAGGKVYEVLPKREGRR
ncbi:MAG: hypothetical protein IJM30_02955 [Thermoguttaceae bacterium]|nr:hypothetical protein [Thermoguttaceae bacterium]